MRQLGYYFVITLLSLGNLAFAIIAWRQRDKQIQGNALRETQVELAELRNEMAQQRVEYLRAQVDLLREIRDALVAEPVSEEELTRAAPSSRPETRPQRARTSPRSPRQPRAPA